MPSLRRMIKSLRRSSAEDPGFTLDSATHINVYKRLLDLAKTPQVTIHFEILNSEPQKLTLHSSGSSRSPQDASLTPDSSEPIYAIASYTKILINAAFTRILSHDDYRHLGLSWQTPACDLFNRLRRNRRQTTIRRLWGNPGLRQLLSHFNGFAPMNRYLLGPDGAFIMSEEEFIQDGPRITEDKYKTLYPDREWQEYSNGNHIFAGMILEQVTGLGLQEALQKLLFDWLNMTETILSEAALARTANKTLVVGYHMKSEKQAAFAVPSKYLSDVVEVAALGARSSTEDVAKLNRVLLRSLEEETAGPSFPKTMMFDFFRPEYKMTGGGAVTLAGLFTLLNSKVAGEESLNQTFRTSSNISTYILGLRPDGSPCNVYYKGGSVDGFACSVYLLLKDRAFVIVFCNSSGPFDPTDHIARYILQEAFQLDPSVDVLARVEPEFRAATSFTDRIAAEDVGATVLSTDVGDLAGQYQHSRYTQQMTITPAGKISIHGPFKADVKHKSSSLMQIVYTDVNKVRILEGSTPFGLDRWSTWEDLDFVVHRKPNGGLELIGNNGKDCFIRM